MGERPMPESSNLLKMVTSRLDQEKFRQQHWEGTFNEYLDIVSKNPRVSRNAFQRVFDMILGYGFEKYTLFKADIVKYNFFNDPIDSGADAVFGLDKALERLVDIFKSAAQGLGTEKRILLLHGPVGSAKSTIARLLKKGLEAYSKTDPGKVYTYSWRLPHKLAGGDDSETYLDCPMHEEPLLLIPREARAEVLDAINERLPEGRRIRLYGDICPFCRKVFGDLL